MRREGVNRRRFRGQSGVALLLAIMATLLLSALVAALVVLTSTDALIASSFRGSREAFYSAEAVGEWSLGQLATMTDEWTSVAIGTKISTFADGAPTGVRTLGGEAIVDLSRIAAANPGWHLFAYGPFGDLVRSSRASQFYVVSLVAQEESGLDGLKLRALAFGPRGARKAAELSLLRSARGVHVVSWAEIP